MVSGYISPSKLLSSLPALEVRLSRPKVPQTPVRAHQDQVHFTLNKVARLTHHHHIILTHLRSNRFAGNRMGRRNHGAAGQEVTLKNRFITADDLIPRVRSHPRIPRIPANMFVQSPKPFFHHHAWFRPPNPGDVNPQRISPPGRHPDTEVLFHFLPQWL